MRRASRGSTAGSSVKPFTSPAMRMGNALASKPVIDPMPLRPSSSARQVVGTSLPTGVTAPRPVITTRRVIAGHRSWNEKCKSKNATGEFHAACFAFYILHFSFGSRCSSGWFGLAHPRQQLDHLGVAEADRARLGRDPPD